MNNFIDSIQDTRKYLAEIETSLDSTIDAILKSDNRLKSFLLLKMILSKSHDALDKMKEKVPEIEKRLLSETDETCRQAADVVKGVKTHSDWCKDIIDAIGSLCHDTDLETRQNELHNQISEMENGLKTLVGKRNGFPLEQLDKES